MLKKNGNIVLLAISIIFFLVFFLVVFTKYANIRFLIPVIFFIPILALNVKKKKHLKFIEASFQIYIIDLMISSYFFYEQSWFVNIAR